MTVHPLHAGNGYEYLTRQVAHGDVPRERGQELADYYTAHGAPPGRWKGAGTAALGVSGHVSEAQMKALFGEGIHPDSAAMKQAILDRQAEFAGEVEQQVRTAAREHAQARTGTPFDLVTARTAAEHQVAGQWLERDHPATGAGERPTLDAFLVDLTDKSAAAKVQTHLGRRFPTFDTEREDAWRTATAKRLAALARDRGIEPKEADRALRAQARAEVGREWFERDKGRAPVDQAELKKYVTRVSKPTPQPVAGYDLVFTPSKSVSVLWGLGDEETRRAIEDAHHAAVDQVVAWIEQEVAFTRAGAGGIRQVETRGLVATAFDHFDSRAGDPNLHTHLAVANKIQGVDGKWRSIDGRVMHAAGVAGSERYNALIEKEVVERLGVVFEDRLTAKQQQAGKRPTREIAGVPTELIELFSARRNRIEHRFDELRERYRAEHGKEPSKALQHELAQQATLDTREGKDDLHSLEEKVAGWVEKAQGVVGPDVVEQLVTSAREIAAQRGAGEGTGGAVPTAAEIARSVVDRVSQDRARWKAWHLLAETLRQVGRVPGLGAVEAMELVEEVAAIAQGDDSVLLEAPDPSPMPKELQRSNGESVYRQHNSEWYSSPAVLEAESRLLDATQVRVVPSVDEEILTAWERTRESQLDTGQAAMVRHFATSDRLVATAVGAAGAGKSTAMKEYAVAVHAVGGRVLALAPAAVAAQGLGEKIGTSANTIEKILHTLDTRGVAATGVAAGDVLLVDEAGMASTRSLDKLVGLARETGAVVRLLGDPSQLTAVEAGGAFRLLVNRTEGAQLDVLHRFDDPAEAEATLGLRAGDTHALDFYEDSGRIHDGTRDALVDRLYSDWEQDQAQGFSSVMMAADRDTVRELAVRARLTRIASGEVTPELGETQLRDGTKAAVGDVIVTRKNNRRIVVRDGKDYAKNGDMWTVKAIGPDGSIQAQPKSGGPAVWLPADYAGSSVELGYASTIHRAQGITVNRARVLVDHTLGRSAFYVAMSRGEQENHAYVPNETVVDIDMDHATDPDRWARHVLEDVVRRDDTELSATETIEQSYAQAESLARLVPEYEDAIGAAAAQTGRIDEVLAAAATPALAALLREDPAWHALAARIAALDADDPQHARDAVTAAIAQAALDDARSPAATLAARLDRSVGTIGGLESYLGAAAGEPAAISEPSGEEVSLEAWLTQRRQAIAERVDALTEQAAAERPAWLTAALPAVVEPGEEAYDEYRAAVRAAAAYRDRYAITDSALVAGHEPDNGQQLRDYERVHALVDEAAAAAASAAQQADEVRQAWLQRALGPEPEVGAPYEEAYRDAADAVEDYRRRYGITDSRHWLGERPADPARAGEFDAALARVRAARGAMQNEPSAQAGVDPSLAKAAEQARQRAAGARREVEQLEEQETFLEQEELHDDDDLGL